MTAPDTTLLNVNQVSVQIAGSQILHEVSFAVPGSGVTALLGRNGVGKTTTLLAIMALAPRTGSVRFDSDSLDGAATHEVASRGIGYVPEDREVFAGLTVAENLRLAERAGTPSRYDLVYSVFPDLAERQRQAAGTLSGGQQQMLALARVLLVPNRLLLVDEPTKGLAPQVVADVTEVLRRAAETAPVLLVEQNLGVVRRLARDAVVLDQGRVVHTGHVADLLAHEDKTKALLGVGLRRRDAR